MKFPKHTKRKKKKRLLLMLVLKRQFRVDLGMIYVIRNFFFSFGFSHRTNTAHSTCFAPYNIHTVVCALCTIVCLLYSICRAAAITMLVVAENFYELKWFLWMKLFGMALDLLIHCSRCVHVMIFPSVLCVCFGSYVRDMRCQKIRQPQ